MLEGLATPTEGALTALIALALPRRQARGASTTAATELMR
jgi:hypothetical protein